MLSLNIANFASLQKYFPKPIHLILRRSVAVSVSSCCKKCQQMQIKQLSTFAKKKLITESITPLGSKPTRMLSPALPVVSLSHTTSFFNETFKDRLHKWGITIPAKYSQEQLEVAAKVLLNGIYMKVKYSYLSRLVFLI